VPKCPFFVFFSSEVGRLVPEAPSTPAYGPGSASLPFFKTMPMGIVSRAGVLKMKINVQTTGILVGRKLLKRAPPEGVPSNIAAIAAGKVSPEGGMTNFCQSHRRQRCNLGIQARNTRTSTGVLGNMLFVPLNTRETCGAARMNREGFAEIRLS
jgi:hypothetical protein